MRILISGASIAGPVCAYWLSRFGFNVTVVERAPELRLTGGHAVDLFAPALEVSDRMGLLGPIMDHATRTSRLRLRYRDTRTGTTLDYRKLLALISDRHVEIMRDDLSQIYYHAGRKDVEYIFGDEVVAIGENGVVSFARSSPRHFDLVIGADGLRSGVRQLVFGSDAGRIVALGAYFSVFSVPKSYAREGELLSVFDVNRVATIYTADYLTDARAVFIFRPAEPLSYHHRDEARMRALVREAYAGMTPFVDELLDTLRYDNSFYFDSIDQIILPTWSKGRVTLVGDAGYCPGPAIGGSTSLAVLGAYVLAGELAKHQGDHERAFRDYETAMAVPVAGSRATALSAARTLVPSSRFRVRSLIGSARALSLVPASFTPVLSRLAKSQLRFYDSVAVPDYTVA
jgi:2-polyprenyl-6-methoxyphenol hydroxylase-like FAD-dependent oxidoreductase